MQPISSSEGLTLGDERQPSPKPSGSRKSGTSKLYTFAVPIPKPERTKSTVLSYAEYVEISGKVVYGVKTSPLNTSSVLTGKVTPKGNDV